MRFSERYGYKSVKERLQVEEIDNDLKNLMWNFCTEIFNNYYKYRGTVLGFDSFLKFLWTKFFKNKEDEIPTSYLTVRDHVDERSTISWIKNWYYKSEWYEVYDFIEFVMQNVDNTSLVSYLNSVLESEKAA
jgi:hypothetical protein